jgi:hypothetical protein
MQPYDADSLMHGVIVTRGGLECYHPVESEYCSNPNKIITALTAKLCAYYVGSSVTEGFAYEHLNIEFKNVLMCA